jgi:hypothetical protein
MFTSCPQSCSQRRELRELRAGVAEVWRELRAGVAGEVASPFPLAPGEVASPFPLAPGEVASPFPLAPGEVASPFPPAPGEVASPFPPAPGEVDSPFPPAPGEVASPCPPAPGEVTSLARLARLNRSVRSTARPPRACSPSRFASQSARRGCSVSRLGFPPRSARARSSTTTTSLALVTCAGTFLRQPAPVAAPQPFRASRGC